MQRARGFIDVARSDSLVRNSLYTMATTIVTAGLGYIFWIVSAHVFTKSQVGLASAVISACSTVALLTYLGSWAMLIERLHLYERSRRWTAFLFKMCAATATCTAVVAAAVIPFLAHSKSYSSFFHSMPAVALVVIGSATWTLVNLFSAAFIAARRADRYLSIQTLVSVAKVLLVVPVAAAGLGAVGIVGAWVGSAILGVVVGALWWIPRLGLGRSPGVPSSSRRADSAGNEAGTPLKRLTDRIGGYRETRGDDPLSLRPSASYLKRLLGQHITSVGGAATPLILPILVALRLGVTLNAYFYITWMIGGVFFMVSPSIANAIFAESVRSESNLRVMVTKAFRVTSLLLLPAMVIMIASGRLILGIFGASYGHAGYGLLVILAISAVPDSVSNIAVAVFRVTNRISYSATLNIGILITATVGAWFLMPSLGIVGAGVGWLCAQLLGAIASIPAYVNLGRRTAT